MLSKTVVKQRVPLGSRSVSHSSPGREHRKVPRHEHPNQYKELPERELLAITRRRVHKAERDERMDLTRTVTPVKTYMGGFTRPSDIRATNWFSGGRYREIGKTYESPPPAAYESHTVVLLESRYPIVHEIGRADILEHIVVVCREADLPLVLEQYNSKGSPEMEAMENSRWPWSKQKGVKRTVWWDQGEDPDEVGRRLWAGEGPEFDVTEQDIRDMFYRKTTRGSGSSRTTVRRRAKGPSAVPTTLLAESSAHALPLSRVRPLHTSSLAASEKKSTTPAERAQIPASSWSKPPKASQDAQDDVVPIYYIERKRQADEISERKETEGGLMAQLSAGILSEGIAAQTRVREEKIPVEVLEEDGVVRHPSGFEPPTPETEFHPVAAKPNLVDDPLLTTVKLPWDQALSPSEPDVESSANTAPPQSGSRPPSSRGFHTSAIVRATEDSTIPFHVLNVIAHTGEGKVLDGNTSVNDALTSGAPSSDTLASSAFDFDQERPDEDEQALAKELEYDDALKELDEEDAYTAQIKAGRGDCLLGKDRERWLATLKEAPYWRPLLTATFSTRPLALTFARLSRGHPRGVPYYSTVPPEDRKDGKSLSLRLREMRLRRMRLLGMDIARIMRGERGGMIGIRFGVNDRGRGIDGEGLADPIPVEKRVIKFGVGEWYGFADSTKELIRHEAEDAELGDGVEVFGIDEFGRRTDGVEWTEPNVPLNATESVARAALKHLSPRDRETMTHNEKLQLIDEYVRTRGKDLLPLISQKHRSVFYPSVLFRLPKRNQATEGVAESVQNEAMRGAQEDVNANP